MRRFSIEDYEITIGPREGGGSHGYICRGSQLLVTFSSDDPPDAQAAALQLDLYLDSTRVML
jgi:hypothetical protein